MKIKNLAELKDLINENKGRISRFGIDQIGIFGSYVTNSQTNDSDIDLLIRFANGQKSYHNFIELSNYLEQLFDGQKIDLVTEESISPYLKPYIIDSVQYVEIS